MSAFNCDFKKYVAHVSDNFEKCDEFDGTTCQENSDEEGSKRRKIKRRHPDDFVMHDDIAYGNYTLYSLKAMANVKP